VVTYPHVSPTKYCKHLSSPLPPNFYMPAHLIPFDQITRVIFGEEYRSLSSSLCSFLHYPATSSLLGPNILLSVLFSNALNLCSSFNVSDQVSRQYKTSDKVIVLCFLIFRIKYG
jgi:hypothetical protein